MTDRNDKATGRPEDPYGGASVDERAAAMRGDMTDEEIAVRNKIPTTVSNVTPARPPRPSPSRQSCARRRRSPTA